MVGFNENRSRFYLSEDCYIDLIGQKLIDTPNGIEKNLRGDNWAILDILIRRAPNKVTNKEIIDALQAKNNDPASVATEEIHKKIYNIRKLHSRLHCLIENVDKSYRLNLPVISDSPPETIARLPIQNIDVTHSGDLRSSESAQQLSENLPSTLTTIDVINPTFSYACTLKSTQIATLPNFVSEAREDTYAALDKAFNEHHVVFLQGLGGIGKSEIAKYWAVQKKQEGMFDNIVFAQLNTEENNSNVTSVLNDDTIFVITGDFRNRGDIFSAGREESAEEYFQRKLAKIMQICDEKTLIIIDNYDIADPCLAKLFAGNYRLLVTTRNKYDGIDFPFIHVGEIKDIKHLKTIFFNNLGNERDDISYDDPYIEKLFELVSNHTLAIEIIAKSLADSVEDTPTSLYEKMVNAGMHAIEGEVESYVSKKALSPSECIQILFNLSRLESDSDFEYKVQVLTFMAAMPTRGIELGLFKSWSNNKTHRAAKTLIKKNWLREDTGYGDPVISMHPLIKEIVWHNLKPSVEKCSIFIDNFKNDDYVYIDGIYHQSTEVKEQYLRVVLSLLSSFPVCDLTNFDFYCKLQRTLHFCAKAELALHLSNTLKCMLEEIEETDTWRYAYVKYRIGAVHDFLYRDFGVGIKYFLEAEELMCTTATRPKEKMWLAFLYRELACAYCRALFDDSLPNEPDNVTLYLDKGQLIVDELIKNGLSNTNLELYRGTLCVWRSKLEVFRRNLITAKNYIAEAEEEFTRFGYINTIDKATIFDIRAQIYAIEGDYAAEATCLKEAADVFVGGFGEHHRDSIKRAIKLALAYAKSEQLPKAIKLLLHYKEITVKMYGEDEPLTASVRETLRILQQNSNNQ